MNAFVIQTIKIALWKSIIVAVIFLGLRIVEKQMKKIICVYVIKILIIVNLINIGLVYVTQITMINVNQNYMIVYVIKINLINVKVIGINVYVI